MRASPPWYPAHGKRCGAGAALAPRRAQQWRGGTRRDAASPTREHSGSHTPLRVHARPPARPRQSPNTPERDRVTATRTSGEPRWQRSIQPSRVVTSRTSCEPALPVTAHGSCTRDPHTTHTLKRWDARFETQHASSQEGPGGWCHPTPDLRKQRWGATAGRYRPPLAYPSSQVHANELSAPCVTHTHTPDEPPDPPTNHTGHP